jgi:hypothetical protein
VSTPEHKVAVTIASVFSWKENCPACHGEGKGLEKLIKELEWETGCRIKVESRVISSISPVPTIKHGILLFLLVVNKEFFILDFYVSPSIDKKQ